MPFTLSPSRISQHRSCPRCFWRLIHENVKRPRGFFPTLPSGMDRVIKQYFDGHRKAGTIPLEIQSAGARLYDDGKNLDEWRDWKRGLRWKDKNNNALRGALDDLLEKDAKLIVLDYKTYGFDLKPDTASHYQDQLDLYNLLLRNNGHSTAEYSYLLFYIPQRVEPDPVIRFESERIGACTYVSHIVYDPGLVKFKTVLVRRDVDIRNAWQKYEAAIKTLEGPMPAPSPTCGLCNWTKKHP